jgi:hypothetical protein
VESGGPSIGKDGESDAESRHLQGCSPRLCRLKTNGLASTCQCYGPSKPRRLFGNRHLA